MSIPHKPSRRCTQCQGAHGAISWQRFGQGPRHGSSSREEQNPQMGNAAVLCPEEEGKQVTALVWSLRGSSQAQLICVLAPPSPRCPRAGGETKGCWRLNSEPCQLRRTGRWAPASPPPWGLPWMKVHLQEARTPRAGTASGQSWMARSPS